MDCIPDDCHLRHEPHHDSRPSRVRAPTYLSQIEPGHDAQPHTEQLEQEADDGGPQQHPDQTVAGSGACLLSKSNEMPRMG